MKSARFFVTVAALMAAIAATACGDKKDEMDPQQRKALQDQGKASQDESEALIKELASTYKIIILDETQVYGDNTLVSSRLMGQKFNWHRLTLAERKAAREKLAQLVAATSTVIKMEQDGVNFIAGTEKAVSRHSGAVAFQESLNRFEATMGEQYEPATPGLPPVYHSPIDI